MYVILCGSQALVVDPFVCHEALEILMKARIAELLVVLTHEHYDHISGVNWIKQNLFCQVLCTENCARLIKDSRKNLSHYIESSPFCCEADVTFSGQVEIPFARRTLNLIETPGHSKGSLCLTVDQLCVFTGDSLVNGKNVVTKLPGGSRSDYENITLPFLQSLPTDIQVFPGHGEPGKLGDLLKVGSL